MERVRSCSWRQRLHSVHLQYLVSERQIRELASEHDARAREFSRFPVHTERVWTNATLSQAPMTCKVASFMEKTKLLSDMYPNSSSRQPHLSWALAQSCTRANERAPCQTCDSNDVFPFASTLWARLARAGNTEPQTRTTLAEYVLRHAPCEQGLNQNLHRFARTGPDRRDLSGRADPPWLCVGSQASTSVPLRSGFDLSAVSASLRVWLSRAVRACLVGGLPYPCRRPLPGPPPCRLCHLRPAYPHPLSVAIHLPPPVEFNRSFCLWRSQYSPDVIMVPMLRAPLVGGVAGARGLETRRLTWAQDLPPPSRVRCISRWYVRLPLWWGRFRH